MKLSYCNLTTGERHEVTATVTADHRDSSYGQPVIVLDSNPGAALDINSWILLNYRIEQASPEEAEQIRRVLIVDPHIIAAYLGSKGGQSTSPAKASAARENGKRGGRPRKQA